MELETMNGGMSHGQVLVKMICAGICGAQLQEISGQKGDFSFIPHMLGHEGCGTVTAIGNGVTHVQPNDKVVLHWRKGEGCEAALPTYSKGVKAGPVTTFAEYVIVGESRVTKVPMDFPADLGALLGCALSTALATIENVAKVKWGESVMVIGCGGVGLSLIYAAKLAHAYPIVGVDQFDKRKWVEALGADFRLHHPSHLAKFDVIIDTTGQAPLIEYLAPSGRYIMVGQPAAHDLLYIFGQRMFTGEGQKIEATQGGGFAPSKDIPRYVNLWRGGMLDDYKKLISHRVSLADINTGIDLMRTGKAARVMVDF
jgi:S-(hydroxymethyl)glutathione dehydrogenase/alcohol dehydrogenase